MNRRMLTLIALSAFVALGIVIGPAEQAVEAQEDAKPEYVSQRGCKKCHFKQAKSWKKTVHAKAMDSLKQGVKVEEKKAAGLEDKDYTTDPSCLKCHTTGYGEPGGYPAYKADWSDDEAKLAKNNAGVGCESCHGPGSLYGPYKGDHEDYKRPDVEKLGLVWDIKAETCTACHNEESPTAKEFNFEESVKDDDRDPRASAAQERALGRRRPGGGGRARRSPHPRPRRTRDAKGGAPRCPGSLPPPASS